MLEAAAANRALCSIQCVPSSVGDPSCLPNKTRNLVVQVPTQNAVTMFCFVNAKQGNRGIHLDTKMLTTGRKLIKKHTVPELLSVDTNTVQLSWFPNIGESQSDNWNQYHLA